MADTPSRTLRVKRKRDEQPVDRLREYPEPPKKPCLSHNQKVIDQTNKRVLANNGVVFRRVVQDVDSPGAVVATTTSSTVSSVPRPPPTPRRFHFSSGGAKAGHIVLVESRDSRIQPGDQQQPVQPVQNQHPLSQVIAPAQSSHENLPAAGPPIPLDGNTHPTAQDPVPAPRKRANHHSWSRSTSKSRIPPPSSEPSESTLKKFELFAEEVLPKIK